MNIHKISPVILLTISACTPTFMRSAEQLKTASDIDLCSTDDGMIGYDKVKDEILRRNLNCEQHADAIAKSREESMQNLALISSVIGLAGQALNSMSRAPSASSFGTPLQSPVMSQNPYSNFFNQVPSLSSFFSSTSSNPGSASVTQQTLNPTVSNSCTATPKCKEISGRAEAYVARIGDTRLRYVQPGVGGGAQAGADSYCISMVAAEANRACADDLKASGRPDCADLAYRQADEFLRVAEESAQSSQGRSSARGSWKPDCGWN